MKQIRKFVCNLFGHKKDTTIVLLPNCTMEEVNQFANELKGKPLSLGWIIGEGMWKKFDIRRAHVEPTCQRCGAKNKLVITNKRVL